MLAIFDLDNTLLAGDSDYAWGKFLCEHNLVNASEYQKQNDAFFADYSKGTLDVVAYQNFCQAILAQHDVAVLQSWHKQFMAEKIEPLILPKALQLLDFHRLQNHTLLILTATNEFIAAPIAQKLGVEHLIACECGKNADGSYSGQMTGVPSFGMGKITRLRQWLEFNSGNLVGAYFYSDSHNDLPLLELVPNPVAVDPDEKLRTVALAKSWQILSLR